ncbi:MAG: hypothetical protein OES53_07225 [Xanthomonadales bacterium]|nr:hypothetical protein [Xanthomonadales bacterium]MDH3941439.1 hypothetical protein [Xanthomonadales bacterium]MDH4000616.1 hypothetical protein [Xanthomonadales bacterium]
MRFTLLVLAAGLVFSNVDAAAQTDVAQDIRQLLGQENLAVNGVDILARDIVEHVYKDNAYQPYWTDSANILELMQLIEGAADHGLKPTDYNIEPLRAILQRRQQNPSAAIAAESDIMLTESLLRYGYSRRYGKADPAKLDSDFNFRRETLRNQCSSTKTSRRP